MTREQKRELKRQADELMRNPVLKQFFDSAEANLFRRFKGAMFDKEETEKVRLQMLGLQAFQEFMHQTLIDGNMVERELDN
jgi:hypothetical protein